jgi:DNA/RNA-binding protein KIN17
MKKERATTSDEQRERLLIAEQIEKAANEAGPSASLAAEEEGLKRTEGLEKVVLSFSAKAPAPSEPSVSAEAKPNALKLKSAVNPLKRPNVFKTALSTAENDAKSSATKRPSPLSAAEQLIQEDRERKRRRMDRESVQVS